MYITIYIMNSKIVCILPICTNPTNNMSIKGEERNDQYIEGLNTFFGHLDVLNKPNIDIIIFDNTIGKHKMLPEQILKVIPSNVRIITDNVNNYGCINKGAGLIECWRYCNDIIKQYDYLIHFEPRQLLLNFNFIQNFLENPRNLFTYGQNGIHFNTGLFCINSETLLLFIDNIDLQLMVSNFVSIEYAIFDFFKNNNIPFSVTEKMELLWFPYLEKEIEL